ncbi:MAG: SpoIIE family protein phosphatase [Clostridia bacterium]|nr:SpoIIE family protein phosphatase [Clostridia bacterium]
MKKLSSSFSYLAVLQYLALAACMMLLNFVLPGNEPISFALYYAVLACRFNPFAASAGYLLASAGALSLTATLSAAIQAACFLFITAIYTRLGRTMKYERVAYAILLQLPFIFLFPLEGYAIFPFAPTLQKLLIGGFIVLLSILFEGGMSALMERAFRTRLSAGELTEIALMWLFLGMGAIYALGVHAFYVAALSALLLAAVLIKSTAAVPFAIVLSLPLAIFTHSAIAIAEFAIYASIALLFLPYGKAVSSLSTFIAFAAAMYFEGLYENAAIDILLTLLACAIPVAIVLILPEKLLRRANKSLVFYRARNLPRLAVNRARRAVGEQLYEVSALFREIENSFQTVDTPDDSAKQIRGKLTDALCTHCPNLRSCEEHRLYDNLDKLIAVGKAKGKANFIDLPSELSARCSNTSGLLFVLNKQLADYTHLALQLDCAREGRRLLAKQAHGVSEILKEIALEQSAEYVFSDEEHVLANALAREGIISTEIFLYGEGEHFTATLTLEEGVRAKKLLRIASEALGVSLALSEKIPLTVERACFVLRRKPTFDAAFGIASNPKAGELASGDTHSVLKIDERRFIVALSDGMGSGEEARRISDRTLSLLESFYKAKMPSETVLSTVNSLVAFSSEETFSCLDLAAVNLDTGIADVVKIGSPPGFVLSGETLQVLEGESLPIGALEAIHPTCLRVELKADDFLIFMSDGITAAFGSPSELCSYLSRLHPLNPQSLAEEILKSALRRYQGKAEDDMTVLAVKLTKSA